MTKIESYRDLSNRCTEVMAKVYDREVVFDPQWLVADVRYKMVCAIVDRIMDQIGPKLDAAITEAFSDFGKDEPS